MSEFKYVSNPIDLLRKSGLLFEINRQVLHPLGLALAVELPEQPEEDSDLGIIHIVDCTDDPEGLVYDTQSFFSGVEKYNQYMDKEGDARLASRFDELGFYIQNIPDPYYIKNGIELQTEDGTPFKVSSKWLEVKVREWFDIELEEFLQTQIGFDIEPIHEAAVEEHAIID